MVGNALTEKCAGEMFELLWIGYAGSETDRERTLEQHRIKTPSKSLFCIPIFWQ